MLAVLLLVLLQPVAPRYTPQELWQEWPDARFVETAAPCLRHADLTASLRSLEARHSGSLRLEEAGRSFQGRPIHLLTLGRGPRHVLLWSQMHGDEPSATPALLDIADFLLTRSDGAAVETILEELTLTMIPMLNPDGTEIYSRRNAQGIDINRDALNLATPEGRILKRVRDRHAPVLGFNLHDQNRRTAVGDTGRLATNAVLAVAGDPEGTLTPGRLLAKRACAAIVEALAPLIPGGMARYDEDWSPRAFGDNLTAWGTPVVLIESGGLPPGRDLSELTRLNFVAILSVLQDLAADDLAGHDPRIYEALLRNESDAWSDVAVRGGYLLQPGTGEPFRADLSFDRLRDDRQAAGCALEESSESRIVEVGDSRFMGAGREVDASDSLILAPFTVGARGWSARTWLDPATLERLARMGVGTVRWAVARRRLEASESLARSLRGPGRTRVEVVAGTVPAVAVTLRRPPSLPPSDTLAALLGTLGRARPGSGSPADAALAALGPLWPAPETSDGLPALRPGRPASFLLVSPAVSGRIDLEEARLAAVWIDGFEARAAR